MTLVAAPGRGRGFVRIVVALDRNARAHVAGVDWLDPSRREALQRCLTPDAEVVRTVAGYALEAHRQTSKPRLPDVRLELDLDGVTFHIMEDGHAAPDNPEEGSRCFRAVGAGGDHGDCNTCGIEPDVCPTLLDWAHHHSDAPGAAGVLAQQPSEAAHAQ